ncbi:uncharacterized protein [Branchiostoma lanceolatum]|uniref:uncharacterized protein n=1 Tax=Branchiostoma lanceolatum TaxID=7740 RepID=UPI003454B1E5
MYNKVLTRCGDPETKQVMEHRIMYTEKIRKEVRRRSSRRKSRPTEGRPTSLQQQYGNITKTDFIQDQHLHPDIASNATIPGIATNIAEDEALINMQYKDHLKEGESSLAGTDLDSAEQHFAAALKTVHVRDSTAQLYQREVGPLCKLGDVYSKRGQQTGDGGDFVKAAALYNAAMARSEDQVTNGKIEVAIKEVEKLFLKYLFGIHYIVNEHCVEKHKTQLKEMRDQIKLEIETIDQQLDPYVHDEDDPCVREIEAKRAQAVRQLFERIAEERRGFISQLVEECIGLMDPPPCKYALIGLGSQATGLVTPYSDLEFAILVEEESEECLVYFRNLTRYLHLKVVNLGETILPAMGIRCLNDFYSMNPLDNWYYDSVTPRGFAFDGSMPKASKTPLGRQGAKTAQPGELICTPENMASILQNDATLYLKEGYHLATILRNPCLITGDQALIDTYVGIIAKVMQADGNKLTRQMAQETLKENIKSYHEKGGTVTANMIDVKKELYRFPAVAVDCLALFADIIPTTVWKTIEDLELTERISAENAHHLLVLLSISAELRLRTYIANGGQKEILSALASMESMLTEQEQFIQSNDDAERNRDALKRVFYLPNVKQLFRYYYTAMPLEKLLSKYLRLFESSELKPVIHSIPTLYSTSSEVRATMYFDLCRYRQAIDLFNKALSEDEGAYNTNLRHYLGLAWHQLGDHQRAIGYHKEALNMTKGIFGQEVEYPFIGNLLQCIGSCCDGMGDYKEAVSYYEQALKMDKKIYGQSTPQFATTLKALGDTWKSLGDPKKAISLATQALQIQRSIYGQSTAHPSIATSLLSLGKAFSSLGDYRKSITYLEEALQMERSLYGQYAAHPSVAATLGIVGNTWLEFGDSRRAISYFDDAMQMHISIFGNGKAHPNIAGLLVSLGLAWYNLADYRLAIRYHEQALQMHRSIHGRDTPHNETAHALNNLGLDWYALGDYSKASSYYEEALQTYRSVYGQNTIHWDIARSYSHLGQVCDVQGEHRKAVSYFEQALQMLRSIFGKSTTHPLIADVLNNLATACINLHNYTNAITHFEKALQMYRRIYGPSKAHPDIAMALDNLGGAWGILVITAKLSATMNRHYNWPRVSMVSVHHILTLLSH